MGRKSQERMTGYTYEQRVKGARGFSIRRLYRQLTRINKPEPTRYANIRRHGEAPLNPHLVGKSNDPPKERRNQL